MENNNIGASEQYKLTNNSFSYLRKSVPWIKFISILGLIGLGLGIIALFFTILFGASQLSSMVGTGVLLIYLAFLIFAFLLYWFLWQLGSNLGKYSFSYDPVDLENALQKHYKYWMMNGVLIIISFILVIIMIFVFASLGMQNYEFDSVYNFRNFFNGAKV